MDCKKTRRKTLKSAGYSIITIGIISILHYHWKNSDAGARSMKSSITLQTLTPKKPSDLRGSIPSSAAALPAEKPIGGTWTIQDIRSNPEVILKELRNRYSGEKLLSALQAVGMDLKSYGSMDDLHHFMCVIDNPAASQSLAFNLISMAGPGDGAKLIEYSKSWVGQAEQDSVNRLLLSRAGELMGMDAMKELGTARDGKPANSELGAVLSGVLKQDPASVREWLLSSNHPSLDRENNANIISQLAQTIPISDILKDAAMLSDKNQSDYNFYINSIVGDAVRAAHNPQDVAAAVFSDEKMTDLQKAAATQNISTTWSGSDLTSAAEWAEGLPKGKIRDSAILGVLNTVHNGRLNMPESAQWAASISDEKARNFALKYFIASQPQTP